MKRVFLDTNILLDIFLEREAFHSSSAKVFGLIEDRKFKGFISAQSFPTIYYILAKQISPEVATKTLLKIRTVLSVSPVNEKVIDLALAADFSDYEDAVQYYSALAAKSEFLITRNKKDFKKPQIDVLSPEEFLHIV
jgi:predicted nucleic acid-binding protein